VHVEVENIKTNKLKKLKKFCRYLLEILHAVQRTSREFEYIKKYDKMRWNSEDTGWDYDWLYSEECPRGSPLASHNLIGLRRARQMKPSPPPPYR
jgi:hypothetical protein